MGRWSPRPSPMVQSSLPLTGRSRSITSGVPYPALKCSMLAWKSFSRSTPLTVRSGLRHPTANQQHLRHLLLLFDWRTSVEHWGVWHERRAELLEKCSVQDSSFHSLSLEPSQPSSASVYGSGALAICQSIPDWNADSHVLQGYKQKNLGYHAALYQPVV